MLIRSNTLSDPSKFYDDATREETPLGQGLAENFAEGFATPEVGVGLLDDEYGKSAQGKAILNTFEGIDARRQQSGWIKWGSENLANMVGFALNPLTIGAGGAGGAIGRGLVRGGGLAARGAAGAARAEITAGANGLARPAPQDILGGALETAFGEKAIQAYTTGVGAGIPSAIVENYDRDTNHINWGGVAQSANEMGAMGLAIGAIPFAYGVLKGKINRAHGDIPEAPVDEAKVNTAFEKGWINKDEHTWWMDYLEHQKDPSDPKVTEDLMKRGTRIAGDNGHMTNAATDQAIFHIFSPDDVSAIHGVMADQLTANFSGDQRLALSDYTVNNRMDFLKQDPRKVDGLRGFIEFTSNKLSKREEKLKEHDEILDENLHKSVNKVMPFSQEEMLKHFKKAQLELSHIKNFPLTIPANIHTRIQIEAAIRKLKNEINTYTRRGVTPKKGVLKRLDALQARLPKLLTPKEELTHLREKLLGRGLKPGFERTADYHRLVDLAHVWHNAKALLDRVHLEYEYNRQESFHDLSAQIVGIADSNTGKFADPESVMRYLKQRLEGNREKVETIEEVREATKVQQEVPANSEQILEEMKQRVQDIEADKAREDFDLANSKAKEFKENEGTFKNLVMCLLGAENG